MSSWPVAGRFGGHLGHCTRSSRASIQVRRKGKPAGTAVPFVIGRHRRLKTRTGDGQPREQPEPTGIDYLRILDQAHGRDLASQINYAALIGAGDDGSPGADAAGDTRGGADGERDCGQEDGRG